MKKDFIFALLFLFFSVLAFLSPEINAVYSENKTVFFEVNDIEPVAKIELPNLILLGNITPGYRTNETYISIKNTGTIDLTITPVLINSTDNIFQNLYFSETKTGSYKKIGNFSMNISKPNIVGGVEEDGVYARVDLTNIDISIPRDRLNHRVQVLFVVMPR
jgi:hypothetical protein